MTEEEIAVRAKAIRAIGDTFARAHIETDGEVGSPLTFLIAMKSLGVTDEEISTVAAEGSRGA